MHYHIGDRMHVESVWIFMHSPKSVILAMERSRNFVVGVMNKLVSAVDKYSWINNVVHTRKARHQLAPNGTTTTEMNRK